MLTFTNYALAWGVYLASALIMYLVCLPILNWVKPIALSKLLKVIVAVLLFTPVISVPDLQLLAPANIAIAFDILRGNSEGAVHAALLMLLALVVMLSMLILEWLLRRLLQSGANAGNATE